MGTISFDEVLAIIQAMEERIEKLTEKIDQTKEREKLAFLYKQLHTTEEALRKLKTPTKSTD
jgi:hypothetical protein